VPWSRRCWRRLVVISDWAGWWGRFAGCRGPDLPNGPPSHRLAPGGFYGEGSGRGHAQEPGNLCDSQAWLYRSDGRPVAKSPGDEHVTARPRRALRTGVAQRPAVPGCWQTRRRLVVIADWAGWWGTVCGLPGTGFAQRPAVPPARAGGLLWGGVGSGARAGAGESLRLTSVALSARRASCSKIPRRRSVGAAERPHVTARPRPAWADDGGAPRPAGGQSRGSSRPS
jgi:hypothetical protein